MTLSTKSHSVDVVVFSVAACRIVDPGVLSNSMYLAEAHGPVDTFVPGERLFPIGDNFQLSVGVLVDVEVVPDDRRHAHGEKAFRHEASVDQLLHSLSESCHAVLLQLVPVALTKV